MFFFYILEFYALENANANAHFGVLLFAIYRVCHEILKLLAHLRYNVCTTALPSVTG